MATSLSAAIVLAIAGCSPLGSTTGGAPPIDLPADASRPLVDAAAVVSLDADRPPPADAGTPGGEPDRPPPVTRDAAPDRAPDPPPDADPIPPPSASYDPCPPRGRPCVALPLGDSLTQGAGSSGGGYRRQLFRLAVAHGQSITFVGSRASGPDTLDGVAFPRNHEGHGGFSIEKIADWIKDKDNDTIATYHPDVVLLEIGTNNGLRHPGPNIPAALAALAALIDQILAADPRLLLIVAQITPASSEAGIKNVEAYNAGIPALVAARAAAGKHVIIADIHRAFVANPNWKSDYLPGSDVHPNDAGYDAMGRGWYDVLGPLLR